MQAIAESELAFDAP